MLRKSVIGSYCASQYLVSDSYLEMIFGLKNNWRKYLAIALDFRSTIKI